MDGKQGHMKKKCQNFEAEKEAWKVNWTKSQKATTTVTEENSYGAHALIQPPSVAKVSERGKVVKFTESASYMLDKRHDVVAEASKRRSLYQLDYKPNHEGANFAEEANPKKEVWHKRFGHLAIGDLQKLAREKLVDGFDLDEWRNLTFCESYPQGKHGQAKFSFSSRRAKEHLDLVHGELCKK